MNLLNTASSANSLVKQFPPCMTSPDCSCFKEISKQDIPRTSDIDSYVWQSINQVESFIRITWTHTNKDSIIEHPFFTTKVTVRLFKKIVSHIQQTRRFFLRYILEKKSCFIDFHNKSVTVSQYLQFVTAYCNYINVILDVMLHPTSKLNVSSFKSILEVHLEILFIFEQYQRMEKFGHSYSSETPAGTFNYFQLFY